MSIPCQVNTLRLWTKLAPQCSYKLLGASLVCLTGSHLGNNSCTTLISSFFLMPISASSSVFLFRIYLGLNPQWSQHPILRFGHNPQLGHNLNGAASALY